MVNDIAYKLRNKNFTVASIHSDMLQNERNQIIKDFRNGETRILLSPELLSRGMMFNKYLSLLTMIFHLVLIIISIELEEVVGLVGCCY